MSEVRRQTRRPDQISRYSDRLSSQVSDISHSYHEDFPNMSLDNDRINRSLGLLEQATGIGRDAGKRTVTPQKSGGIYAQLQTPKQAIGVSFDTPLRLSSMNESMKFATPSNTLAHTSSDMLASSLNASRYNPSLSFLTTPSGLLSKSHTEQSLLATPTVKFEESIMDKTNLLMEAHPGVAASESLYEEFFNSFKRYQSFTEVFTLVKSFEQICKEQVELLSKLVKRAIPGQLKFQKTRDILNILEREKCTWRLLDSLFRDRQTVMNQMEDDSLDTDTVTGKKTEQQIVNSLYERDSNIRQNQIIVDWLESTAADQVIYQNEKVEYYSNSVCWENSLYNLQQKAGGGVPLSMSHVTNLDPDAPIRQNKNLADLDKEDEARLLKNVFSCIRCGQMEEAQKLCKKCSQSWRAATLEGWRLCHDPNMRTVGENINLEPVEGNQYRDVWKMVCWKMAEDERFHMFERAMYAALSGNLRELLPACKTWTDNLWAYFKVIVDQQVEQELRDQLELPRTIEPLPPSFYQKRLTVHIIFQELHATPHTLVENEANYKHHVIQKYMILNDLDTLTEEMAEWLRNPAERLSGHHIRFMAHFIFVLRYLGLQTREEMSNRIVEAYVKDLIEEKRTELVATYVAQLPTSYQVAYYAKFLEGIEEKDDKQRCLQLAEDAGLDVAAITKTVVENIRIGPEIPITSLLSRDSLEALTTQEDQKKIEAIDWLVFDPSQRAEAVKQSNALIRTFLELKKHDAARDVFHKIPQDSVELIYRNWHALAGNKNLPEEDDNAVREHMCVKSYLDALSAFSDWFEHFHNKKPIRPACAEAASFHDKVRYEHEVKEYQMEYNKWEQTLILLTRTVSETAYNVLVFLDGGWMMDQRMEGPVDNLRQEQMMRLRKKCIPMMCTLLHTVLHSRGMYRECLNLADYIASEEFQLYKVFSKEELRLLLSKFKESSSCLLDQDLDALGYEI